jgi:hypothetical protein
MKDLLHIVTSTRETQANRKFIIVREYTDMRGFRVSVKNVTRANEDRQILIEIKGLERVAIDSILIPEERRGLYAREQDALKFAQGRIITDENPYLQAVHQAKTLILSHPNLSQEDESMRALELEVIRAKKSMYEETSKKLVELKRLFQE